MSTTQPIPANAPIEELRLSVGAYNRLKRGGKHLVADVASYTAAKLRDEGVPERQIDEIRARLQANGRSLVDDPVGV